MRAAPLLSLLLLGCPSKTPETADAKAKPAEAKPAEAKAEVGAKADSKASAAEARDDFRRGVPGAMPPGWTRAKTLASDTPATWAIVADETAPSPPHAFAVTESKNRGLIYNVSLRDGLEFQDVDISVAVRAGTGEEDQGGGVVFRADGVDNYYVARWNPLEHNARFYKVVDQVRSAFAAVDTKLDPSKWHTLRVLTEGPNFELFIDGESVLEATDNSIPNAGAVGLWTKADAATFFDDFVVSGS